MHYVVLSLYLDEIIVIVNQYQLFILISVIEQAWNLAFIIVSEIQPWNNMKIRTFTLQIVTKNDSQISILKYGIVQIKLNTSVNQKSKQLKIKTDISSFNNWLHCHNFNIPIKSLKQNTTELKSLPTHENIESYFWGIETSRLNL